MLKDEDILCTLLSSLLLVSGYSLPSLPTKKKLSLQDQAEARTMRISYAFFSLLLLLVSAEFSHARAIHGASAARIPEHTCHKLLSMNRCDLQKCNQECSQEPLGVGECRNAYCSCTYYCKQPPM